MLMVGKDELDLAIADLPAHVFDGHPRRFDRTEAGLISIGSGHVAQDSDFDRLLILSLCLGDQGQEGE
jgi:hypothetical protein